MLKRPTENVVAPAGTSELRAALEGALGRPVVGLERRPCPYRSSFGLEELDVKLDGGDRRELVFKDLGWHSLNGDGRRAKPRFLHDPRREAEVYRRILALAGLGTATCYGTVLDPERGRYWLFLQQVPGEVLTHVGDGAAWEAAARWLAGLHARFPDSPRLRAVARGARVRRIGVRELRVWPRRARAFRPDDAALARVLDSYPRVIDRLRELPASLIHGEFFAANVLVTDSGPCPVDWESAAVGPSLFDLAALVAGSWPEPRRTALALAYRDALPPVPGWPPPPERFLDLLDCCRLHLAVQRLGWSPDWSPPPEQAHDWRGEALHLAERLGL